MDLLTLFSADVVDTSKHYVSAQRIELITHDDNAISAYVDGTDRYQVHILMSDSDIIRMDCSCPYEYNCKHQAAVLQFVLDNPFHEEAPIELRAIHSDLKKATKATLISFIEMLVNQSYIDPELLELHFAKATTKRKIDYKQRLKKILRKHSDEEWGYLLWHQLDNVVSKCQSEMNKLVNAGQIQDLIDFSTALVNEMNDQLLHVDDSYGTIQYLISSALDILKQLPSEPNFNKGHKAHLLHSYMELLDNQHIYEWDYGYEISLMAIQIIETESEKQALLEKVNARPQAEDNDWSRRFRENSILQIQSAIIKKFDGKKAHINWLNKHLDTDELIEELYIYHIEDGDYSKAKQLCLTKRDKATKDNNRNLILKWEKRLLEIAKAENNLEDIKLYSRQLLIQEDLSVELLS